MALTTRISQPAFAIVESSTLNQWLRIDQDTDQSTVALLLASATDYIEGITGQVICSANYTVTFDSIECSNPLNLFPINSITSVVANLTDGTTQALTAGTDYTVRLATSSPSIAFLTVPDTAQSLTVTLNAGYASPATVPAALQHAAAVLVAAGYDSRSSLDQATIGTVAALTARYRRVFL